MNKEKGIIYFSAPWCQPCKQLGPVMEDLERSGMNVKKVNCDYDAITVEKYKIRNIPTLVLTNMSGDEIKRTTGNKTKEQILEFYNG